MNTVNKTTSLVTDEMLTTFLLTYSGPGFEFPDPSRARKALEAALARQDCAPTGASTDEQLVADAAEAIRAENRRLLARDGDGYRASPEDLARAALSVVLKTTSVHPEGPHHHE